MDPWCICLSAIYCWQGEKLRIVTKCINPKQALIKIRMITVLLDGEKKELPDDSRLVDLIPGHPSGLCVALIHPGTTKASSTHEYLIKTNTGDFTLETTDLAQLVAPDLFTSQIKGLSVRWRDRDSVSFGTFGVSFNPARKGFLYNKGDIILGCAGYDPAHSHLIISRRAHFADHGAGEDGGVIGHVISGFSFVKSFERATTIEGAEPVITLSDAAHAETTTDLETPLSDGMQVFTFISVRAWGYNPENPQETDTSAATSVEHMLLALQDGTWKADIAFSNHIRDDLMAGTEVPMENDPPRSPGAVMVRTHGKKIGSLYLYTSQLPKSLAHTCTGTVTGGLELALFIKGGDVFRIKTDPERFDIIGLTLKEAREIAEKRGITFSFETAMVADSSADVHAINESDYLVIEQKPTTTLEILALGEVQARVIAYTAVIDITLDDWNAPASTRIFRELTGLKYHSVGKMPLIFVYDDVYLFQIKIPKKMNVIPENMPVDSVLPGMLGLTNDSRKGVGYVGVRTLPNTEFGPTAEPFSGTNIFGQMHAMEKLAHLKDDDIVYIREIKQNKNREGAGER
jgi:putative methanogenesis marker protein 3